MRTTPQWIETLISLPLKSPLIEHVILLVVIATRLAAHG